MPDPKYVWSLTDHLCRACFGRLLERLGPDDGWICRCSNCGAEDAGGEGISPSTICACGLTIGACDAGIRCVRNPRPRPELPCEVMAVETG